MTVLSGLDTPTGPEPGDHACWTFADGNELTAAVLALLDDGRRRDEQLQFVAAGPHPALLAAVADLPDREELLATGRPAVRVLAEVCGGVPDPEAQVTAFADEAVRSGPEGTAVRLSFSRRSPDAPTRPPRRRSSRTGSAARRR